VKKLWEDEYKNLPTVYTIPSIVPALELDEYDLLAQELNVIGTEPEVDEYDTYTSQSPIPIDCSPLVWWLRDEQKERFPRLSKMDIFSIPAMSADLSVHSLEYGVQFRGIECSLEHRQLKRGSA
jgi:hypothetical protein